MRRAIDASIPPLSTLAGKRLLKEKNGAAAMVRFEKALMLSKALADRVRAKLLWIEGPLIDCNLLTRPRVTV